MSVHASPSPPLPREPWLSKATAHLDWPRLASAVLARCQSESTRRGGLHLAETPEEAEVALAETRELSGLLERGMAPPVEDLRDVEAHLRRLERQGVLDAPALNDVLATLENARKVRAYLAAHRAETPHLSRACQSDASLDTLAAHLRDALDDDGGLSDQASPELRGLRSEIGNLRARIVGRLEQLIHRYESVLSDSYYTLREGRYVLPVRRDAHERVPGIVHAASASGASIFVEPRAIVAQGNRLKMAQAELEREELRLLSELSERVREYLPSFRDAARALDRLDLRHASARLGQDFGGSVPELSRIPELSLKNARHPLLALDGVDVVPNDVSLHGDRAIIISGPNAGGKTVLLKLLGLSALMARCGLPLPVDPGSRVGFFERVLTDVGDEQSTTNNLSTFSAHIQNLSAILAQAGPSTLALLDEVATGTDPTQGGALACAIVEFLCDRNTALAVTTHYEPLKALSMRDPRLRAASVGFDVGRMEPSFKLLLDIPGASSALAIARRFGIPEAVTERAEHFLPEQSQDFDALVADLTERTQRVAEQQEALKRTQSRLDELKTRARDELERQRAHGDRQVAREVEHLLSEVKRARAELDEARKSLRAEQRTPNQVSKASKHVDRVAARVALGGDLAPKTATKPGSKRREARVPEEDIREGLTVYVPHLRSEAVVIEGPQKGRVRVAAGPLKLWVDTKELHPAAEDSSARHTHSPAPPRRGQHRSPDNTLNVRGMRVDDALSLVESFVDRLYASDQRVGFVLHGHGTGALRDAVRKQLRHAHVPLAHIGPAEPDDGGDALTVFHLAG